MVDIESNIQAYRTLAEMLISFRKIILRGLVKQAGENWLEEACPPEVVDRLAERKETELAIDRMSSSQAEDIMSFATFQDLAEIMEHNAELGRMLRMLAGSPDVLVARLVELESLRSKLARARPLNDDELTLLTSYALNLKKTLAGARSRARGTKEAQADAERDELDGRPVAASEETAFHEVQQTTPEGVASADTVVDGQPDTAVAQGVRGALEKAGEEIASDAGDTIASDTMAERRSQAEGPEVPPSSGSEGPVASQGAAPPEADGDTVVEEDSAVLLDEPEAPPFGRPLVVLDPEAFASEVEAAVAADDDLGVLRVLRREIIAVAEAIYRSETEIRAGAWLKVQKSGWFSSHVEELGLEDMARFHELVEEVQIRRAEGAGPDDVRSLLADHGFPALLLRLREIFLRASRG